MSLFIVYEFCFQSVNNFFWIRNDTSETSEVFCWYTTSYRQLHILNHLSCIYFRNKDTLFAINSLFQFLFWERP